jgi:hypothetical protein
VKALSLTQPWAWLVVHRDKRIENRRWNTPLRGTFLIHAAKGMTKRDYYDARDAVIELGYPSLVYEIPGYAVLERGGIVGQADLVGVLEPTDAPTVPWHMAGQYGFELANVRPLAFRPCKGALGFWDFEAAA